MLDIRRLRFVNQVTQLRQQGMATETETTKDPNWRHEDNFATEFCR